MGWMTFFAQAVMMTNRPTIEQKPVELPLAFLRQGNPKEPVELVLGYGGGSCQVYVLRPTQLKNLVADGMRMLSGFITSK